MADSIKRRGFLSTGLAGLIYLSYKYYKDISNKSSLFKLDDLEYDFSRKEVNIDVEVDKFLLDNYKPNIEYMLNDTKDFYNNINVELNFSFVEKLNHSLLKPAEHLGLKILPEEKFGGKGTILMENSLAFIGYRSYSDKDIENDDDYTATILAHEIGHLFGLIHSNRFKDDPVEDYGEFPNIMSYRREGKECCINDFQKKIVHSFLGKGKIYAQLKKLDFMFGSTYLEEIALANNYHPAF